MLANAVLGKTVASEGVRVLRAQHQQRASRKNDVVVPKSGQGTNQVLEDVVSRLAAIGKNVLRRRTAYYGHGAITRFEAAFNVQWLPWAFLFVLGDAKRKFPGMAVGSHIG